jgi:prevent-host-death family protein
MKKVTPRSVAAPASRLSVAEAKTHLSSVLRASDRKATYIHRRGNDVAVLVGVEEYERLRANDRSVELSGFLRTLEQLKVKHGGGADEFLPKRAVFEAMPVAFGKGRRR